MGIEVQRDWENGKIWLSQLNPMENIPMRFNMNIVKPVNIPLAFHCDIYSCLCPGNKEEKDCMSCMLYANTVGSLIYAMKWSIQYISHAVGVVSGHVAKPSKEN